MIQEYSGKLPYETDIETATGRLLVAVACRVEQILDPLHALLDTASEWCVLPPFLSERLGLLPGDGDGTVILSTRFGLLHGHLERLPVTFAAAEGEPLTIDATCFVSEDWPGPLVIGWRGALERICFGFNTTEEAFYFGAG